MITNTGQYAIRAVAYLAEAQAGTETNVTAARIARDTGLPKNYLTKILHTLVQAGVLDSTRGPRGGFRLRLSPDRLTVADVLTPIKDVGSRDCMLSEGNCPHGAQCPSRLRCHALSMAVDRFLRTTCIADLTG